MRNPQEEKGDDFREVVALAAQGDKAAFDKLYRAHIEAIYRFVASSIHDSDEVEDITQEVFIKAWRAIPAYTEMGRPFRAWLYRTAKNTIIDHTRKKKFISLDDIPEQAHPEADRDEPSRISEQKESAQTLTRAIAQLTDDQQEVVLLKFMEEYSNKEIAEITGKSEASIRQLQHRGLLSLKDLLSQKDNNL